MAQIAKFDISGLKKTGFRPCREVAKSCSTKPVGSGIGAPRTIPDPGVVANSSSYVQNQRKLQKVAILNEGWAILAQDAKFDIPGL